MTLPSWLRWLLAGALAALGAVALILHKTTGHAGLGEVAISTIEASHAPAIAVANAKIDELSQDMQTNGFEVWKAQAELRKRREHLTQAYSATGMSTDEVMDRLTKMRL